MFLSPNEGSASGGQRAPLEVGCVAGGTSSLGLTGVERSRDIGGPSSSAKYCGCSTASRESAQRGSGRLHKRGPMQRALGMPFLYMYVVDRSSLDLIILLAFSTACLMLQAAPTAIRAAGLRVASTLLSCGSLRFI
ncbi:hypothetical protein BHE74_00037145 [Ensete ventricosum]|nr:hypothetical protein BHE74_00037145 [Ensete ventricosum]RZS02058.1 hypothetical protein BHM03_00032027 [Ensete ventricosum]